MKPSTPWIIALLASVLLNGALAGFVLHRTADGPDWRPEHGERHRPHPERSGPGFDARRFVFALPDDVRREARARMRSDMEEIGDLFEDSRTARDRAEALMRAEDFDREAVAAALQDIRDTRGRIERHMEAILLDVVEDVDAQTRSDALDAAKSERHGRRFDGDRDGRGPRGNPPPPDEG